MSPTVPVDLSAIPTLLGQSRASHYKKKQSAGRADRAGVVTTRPNYQTTESHIKDALLARIEAETLDPDHTSPAWYDDQVEVRCTSADLVRFYAGYLSTDRYSSAWDDAVAAMKPEQRERLEELTKVTL